MASIFSNFCQKGSLFDDFSAFGPHFWSGTRIVEVLVKIETKTFIN